MGNTVVIVLWNTSCPCDNTLTIIVFFCLSFQPIRFDSQHAREWAGGSTVQYLAHHFTSKFGKQESVTKALRDVELVIIPIMNVDGYDYTWSNNRLWRKNRRQNSLGSWGVDLNR